MKDKNQGLKIKVCQDNVVFINTDRNSYSKDRGRLDGVEV